MKKLFCLFGLLSIIFTVSASEEWLYYKEYPWVWDNKTEDWLYLRGGEDGKIYAYRNSTKEWEEFNESLQKKTWDEQYEEWIQNPEPYGGLEVLQKIKEAKENGLLELDFFNANTNITNLTPFVELTRLQTLYLGYNNISDISPLASLTNLIKLDLYYNSVSDLSPLRNLTKLQWLAVWGSFSNLSPLAELTGMQSLHLESENIKDLSPLNGLTNLEYLTLGGNQITDLTPLAGLTNLLNLNLYSITSLTESQKAMLGAALPNTFITWPDVIIDDEPSWPDQYKEWIKDPEQYGGLEVLQKIKDAKEEEVSILFLDANNISDLTPLAGLTNLTDLNLYDNSISDLTPLAGLTNLIGLFLDDNNISDLSPLTGLTNLEQLTLSINNISDLSPLEGLTNLENLYLDHNNISDLSPLAELTNLMDLFIRDNDNNISDISPLAELTNLNQLNIRSSNISDLSPLTGLTNLTWLELSENNISTSQKEMLEEALPNTSILFMSEDHDDPIEPLFIWEVFYEKWIQNPEPYGGLQVLDEIKKAKEEEVSILHLDDNNISDLTPLAGLTNLNWLDLRSSNISDLTPLAGLTNLIWLDLTSSNISDLSPLEGLTKLEMLQVRSYNISDLTPLAGLTNLTSLNLNDNNISDLSPLAGLTNLTSLHFDDNNISDLTPLAGLTNLTSLNLNDNNISDLTPLAGLTNLTSLNLNDNNISDLSPLAGLTNLTWLNLNDNNITASQKAMLEDALPTTSITWPDVIIDDILDTTPPEITIFSYSGDWPSYNGREGEFPTFSYSAIDNVDGDLTDQVEVTNGFSSQDQGGGEEGWAEVTFSVTDASGNTTIHYESGPVEPIGFLEVP